MGGVCKSCARRFYYSFLFVLTKLQSAVAGCDDELPRRKASSRSGKRSFLLLAIRSLAGDNADA